jgi:hypothetical protein
LEADAMQTSICAYLSVIALAGVALNTLVGWWWADPVAALAMVPIVAKEVGRRRLPVAALKTEVEHQNGSAMMADPFLVPSDRRGR